MSSDSLKPPRIQDATDKEMPPESSSPPKRSDIFEILANQRRRFVLHYLKQNDSPVDLDKLAEQVAAWETDNNGSVKYHERKRVYTALQQEHLPRMDNAGVISFDKNRGTIEASQDLDAYSVYLEVVSNSWMRDGTLYTLLSALGIVVVAGLYFDLSPITLFSELVWAGIFVAVFAIISILHLLTSRAITIDGSELPPEIRD